MDLGTPSHLLAFDSVRGTLGKAKGEQENEVLVLHSAEVAARANRRTTWSRPNNCLDSARVALALSFT